MIPLFKLDFCVVQQYLKTLCLTKTELFFKKKNMDKTWGQPGKNIYLASSKTLPTK